MLNIQKDVPLSQYTTFRIGGPAKYFAEVTTIEELKEVLEYAQKNHLNFFILGGGSNLLVSDSGFPGLAIKMKLNGLKVEGEHIEAEAGVPLAKLIRDSIINGLTGLEWAAGIPGSLGGAIRGNAGAYEGEAKDIIETVKVLNSENMEIRDYTVEECEYGYRSSMFKKLGNLIILSARLKLKKGNKEESLKKMQEILTRRTSKQPQGSSAGSFFVNPVVQNEKIIKEFEEERHVESKNGKVPAGWLIDRADFKGKKVGGAMVSNIHPNYILNTGQATAQDVIVLTSLIKQKIRVKFGVQLKEEVQYIGF
jgi:UDP-N-acetylmuramate dehydrogenase